MNKPKPQSSNNKAKTNVVNSTASHQAPVHFGAYQCKPSNKGGWSKGSYKDV